MTRYPEIAAWYRGLQNYILSSQRFAPLHPFYQRPLSASPSINEIRQLHQEAAEGLLGLLDPHVLALIRQAIDEYVRKETGTPSVAGDESPDIAAALATLSDLGHVDLPIVDAGWVSDMRAYFEAQPVYPDSYVQGPERCSVEEARKGKFGSYPIETVVGCPHLSELANDPRTLGVVERYLGTVPTILGFCAWWSFANKDDAKDAQLFHRDGDDYRFCKLFIYLTDVTDQTGPHAYMEGSHDKETIGELRRNWPGGEGEFNRWFFGTLRKTDGQTKRIFGKDATLLTGPAGTTFLADTSGIHKGMSPQTGERLVCQILYGVSPMVQEHFERLEMGTPATRHLPDWMTEPPNRYVNRMFVSPAPAMA